MSKVVWNHDADNGSDALGIDIDATVQGVMKKKN